jgi:hypothetical protein
MKIAARPTNFAIWWESLCAPTFQTDIPTKLSQKPWKYPVSGVELGSSSDGMHALDFAHIGSYLKCTFAL